LKTLSFILGGGEILFLLAEGVCGVELGCLGMGFLFFIKLTRFFWIKNLLLTKCSNFDIFFSSCQRNESDYGDYTEKSSERRKDNISCAHTSEGTTFAMRYFYQYL